eukprot:CAMPEP_0174338186 /NCGR_PEP_ID=MMETSP0810-20121108/22952_1 /TAXON_ID=73025 ORGANISM="Eutreptiella gymnastica-like, Strain CCMP1594" /NCGR_SAMPLE_ID=MMETSP0810 /ASSEMBLY_ACC=CAM_ASM_000659 /LENGTH=806 /DNA_ID=CAMNT_0015458155 /DNA_START=30 /DNA_END=2446 /DNA_ORIENTATION=+
MGKKGSSDNVKVMVRVRPFNKKEIEENGGQIPFCTVTARQGVIQSCDPADPDNKQEFAFDHVFWSIPNEQLQTEVPFAQQEDVFEHAGKPAIENLFDGFNGCIFAYGQTSSGKTHSMMGYVPPKEQRGLIPRLCEALFERIHEAEDACKDITMTQGANRKVEYKVTLSYLEIYNEKVQDLLTPKRAREEELKVLYDPKTGPTVKGLKSVEVKTWEAVNRQFEIGSEQRSVAATAMNAVSSRSHAVVQIVMHQTEIVAFINGKPKIVNRESRINLVDLAGSEKVQKSQVQGQGLKEAIGINQSLTCLGRVIDGLVKGDKHVPYRDSVLTQLLSDSLGGNSRTTMLAALSPAAINFDETVSTLRYASRARQIVNVVKVNEDPTAQLIRELQEELAQIKQAIRDGDVGEVQALGRRASTIQSARSDQEEKASEIQKMLANLQVREQVSNAQQEQREEKWAQERQIISRGHKKAVAELEEEKEELLRQRSELREKAQELERDVDAQKKEQQRIKEEEQEHKEKSEVEKKALKRKMIVNRFRQASDKALAMEKKEDLSGVIAGLKAEADGLQDRLNELDRQLADRPPKYRGLYIGQSMAMDYPGARVCDICDASPAAFYCPDSGDECLCELCARNQLRSIQTRNHRMIPLHPPPLGIVMCEFCGNERATWTCAECIPERLCSDCDDIRHRNKKRNWHTRVPGVNLGMDAMEQKEEQRPIYPEAPEALMLPPPPTQGGTFMAASYTRSPAGVYGPAASYVRSPAGYGAPAYATYTQPAGSMYRAASPSPVYSAASPKGYASGYSYVSQTVPT